MSTIRWLSKVHDMRRSGTPLYLAIADAVQAAIDAGQLTVGWKLPAQREVARALNVDLTTVSRAYREAQSRGLTDAQTGRGTFVADTSSLRVEKPGLVDMTMNHPPETRALQASMRGALESLSGLVDTRVPSGYGPHAGSPTDRGLGAGWVKQRFPEATADRLVICSGVQGALLLFCLTAVGSGGKLLTESLTYPGIRSIAAHLDIELIGVPMDADGMDPIALAEIGERTGARAVYITPTLHNPTTSTMPASRRKAIAEVVRKSGMLVLEDDVYGLLAKNAPPPVSTFVPDRAFYATSLSKIAAPALRIGYLVAPDDRWLTEVENAMRAVVFSTSPYNVLVARALIAGGYLAEVVSSIVSEAEARQQMANELLCDFDYRSAASSHHGWLTLPTGWSSPAFVARVRDNEVMVVGEEVFATDQRQQVEPGVRLSLGSAPDKQRLRSVLMTLRHTLQLAPGKATRYG